MQQALFEHIKFFSILTIQCTVKRTNTLVAPRSSIKHELKISWWVASNFNSFPYRCSISTLVKTQNNKTWNEAKIEAECYWPSQELIHSLTSAFTSDNVTAPHRFTLLVLSTSVTGVLSVLSWVSVSGTTGDFSTCQVRMDAMNGGSGHDSALGLSRS